MSVTRRAAVIEDPRYSEHAGPRGHPERPERLAAVAEAIAERAGALARLAARPADDAEILRAHAPSVLRCVAEAAARAPVHLDPDTYVAPRSLEVARLAAGASIDLARAVARGDVRAGLAAVRPPGHHADARHSMGFCLFNNVAIAARALQAEEGVERILIVDWDVHHGNGTQEIFEEDASVLYFSTHQWPYYPGTGDFREIGRARGEGATVNVPLPAGSGDDEHVGAFQRVLVPVARDFRPEIILVSCGFDAHVDDPLASMNVTERGFRDLATIVRALAESLCGGRVACVLEGGYASSGLREGTRALLDVLVAESAPPPPADVEAPAGSVLRHVTEHAAAVHGRRHPDVGAA